MDPQPGGSGITTANFYRNGRVYRPRVMHQFLYSSDTEDIVEHAVDEVEDAYSPHESEEEPSSDGEELYWEHIHSRDEAPTVPIYDVSDRSEIEEDISLPVNLFRIFSDELLDMVVQQSNLYAVQ
ncbi:uncharacterized protein LOC119597568 [Penaeus monodon]|uniref:uncharacterized protein LOC119597428 n=1 Tax=Penaeus monodon TaxID=6687 RepID=UPI0018A746BF|nr:uncharacterized protein LOC119597428 [Penaeus monodon]XP_037803070.1 uncharacterized protein LOC119597568 [Penaeus monodon]